MRAPLPLLIGLALIVAACGDTATPASIDQPTTTAPSTDLPPSTDPPPTSAPPLDERTPWPGELGETRQRWTVRVLDRIPHDGAAFTQGLEMTDVGLLEGTGRRGESSLRLVDATSGAVLEQTDLNPALFGEGLTVFGDEIIQLTFTAGVALRYDLATRTPVGEFSYTGEGWGLCATETDLWMSNGSSTLTRRDPETFAPVASVTVTRDGVGVEDLNELECVGEHVVANIWKSSEIVVIEPRSGEVVASIDAAPLVAEIGATDTQAVLNGIADLGDGTLLLGGKLWPTFFVVEVVEVVDATG